jgi:hypothetical protein
LLAFSRDFLFVSFDSSRGVEIYENSDWGVCGSFGEIRKELSQFFLEKVLKLRSVNFKTFKEYAA